LLKFIAQFLPVKVQELNDANLEKSVLKTDDVVLVDYFAPWCSHCIVLEPQFVIAAQVSHFFIRTLSLFYINTCFPRHQLPFIHDRLIDRYARTLIINI
jgi:thiol-disulfide isomerase/thioredoxin